MSQLVPTEHNPEFVQDQTSNLRSSPEQPEGLLSPSPPPSNTPPRGADPEEQNETKDDEEGKDSNPDGVTKKKRRHYCKISDAAREKLIQMVVSKGLTVHEAAHECNINISTAKGIVDIYMKEGRIGKKKKRDRPTNIITNYIIANVNPMQMGVPASVTPVATLYSTRYPPGYPGKQKDVPMQPQPPQIHHHMPPYPGYQNPAFPMNPPRYPMNPQTMQPMGMGRFPPGQLLPPPQMQFPNGYIPSPMMNYNNPYNNTYNPAMFPPNPNMFRQPITSSTQPAAQQPLLSPVKEESKD